MGELQFCLVAVASIERIAVFRALVAFIDGDAAGTIVGGIAHRLDSKAGLDADAASPLALVGAEGGGEVEAVVEGHDPVVHDKGMRAATADGDLGWGKDAVVQRDACALGAGLPTHQTATLL